MYHALRCAVMGHAVHDDSVLLVYFHFLDSSMHGARANITILTDITECCYHQ